MIIDEEEGEQKQETKERGRDDAPAPAKRVVRFAGTADVLSFRPEEEPLRLRGPGRSLAVRRKLAVAAQRIDLFAALTQILINGGKSFSFASWGQGRQELKETPLKLAGTPLTKETSKRTLGAQISFSGIRRLGVVSQVRDRFL